MDDNVLLPARLTLESETCPLYVQRRLLLLLVLLLHTNGNPILKYVLIYLHRLVVYRRLSNPFS